MYANEEEIAKWDEHLRDPWFVGKLKKFQAFIFEIFEDLRLESAEHLIRFVLARQDIKDLKSVVTKINRKRKKQPDYDFDLIEDLVGIKVICPYTSSAKEVMDKMFRQPSFKVEPHTIDEALRTTRSGYRGWHFVAEPSPELINIKPSFMSAKCEIQIKTMIQEAWDAQTHDITYKQEELVDERLLSLLKNQSEMLASHDAQSENFRGMIQEFEEKEKEHRCIAAATYLYLSTSSGIFDYFRKYCNLDLELQRREIFPLSSINMARVNGFIDCYRRKKHLDKDLIKFVAYIALNQEEIEQERMALAFAREFLTMNPQNPSAEDAIAGIYWALNRFEEAIKHGNYAIKKAMNNGDNISPYQDNYCYWVADAVRAHIDVKNDVRRQVFECSNRLSQEHPNNPKYLDTAAFVKISMGNTVEDIKSGRELLKRSRDLIMMSSDEETQKIYRVFSERHEKLAKSRLAKWQ